MPKVSIIVPIYNVENYLDRCMQSLLNQTLKDIEIIMVDDGSPDNCPRLCDEYAKKDSRIKVVHKENAGLGYARNTGLDVATGEYVAFVDSDDYVSIDMYKTLYNYASDKNIDVIYCGFRKEFNINHYLDISECKTYEEYIGESIKSIIPDFVASPPYEKKEYVHDMSVWHSIYRREIIISNRIRFMSERDYVSEDIPFQIDFLTCCKKIAFIPNILYYYCYNQGSLTKSFSISKFEKTKALYHLLLDKTKEFDTKGLRTKRLFIGYIRAMFRLIVTMQIKRSEKILYIKQILYDDIWEDIKKGYKLTYLPIHQRIMLLLTYLKLTNGIYLYAKIMNLRLMTLLKKVGGVICLVLYYGFARYLPSSYSPIVGKFSNRIRIFCAHGIFKYCGKVSTIDRMAYFGTGRNIEIGDYSGIGENCIIPNNTIIGKYVMMAPEVYIIGNNHITTKIDVPMCFQGKTPNMITQIEDDCWIGARVMVMPGRKIGKGCIIAAGAIVTKNIAPYSIVGGNPAKLIRMRK